MKKFAFTLIAFIIFCTLSLLALSYFIDKKLTDKKCFSVQQDKQYIILGHSHPASAYNDSLISNFQNLSSAMEGYFYTYYKAKKIFASNSNIKGVFLEFTNNQITSSANNRIWGEYLPNQLPKYASVMDLHGILFLLAKEPVKVIQALNVALWKNFSFLINSKQDFIKEENWGGFVTSNNHYKKEKIDSLLKVNSLINSDIKNDYSVSNVNLWYLGKIVKLCKENNVKLFFIRSPLPDYVEIHNEGVFNDILKNEFEGIPFLDFKNFKLSGEEFSDMQHLNYKGSKKLSLFFNDLIVDGLLEKENMQEFIDERMKLIKQ